MTRTFVVEVTATVVVKIADGVLDAVTAEWRSMFYQLRSAKDIAEHVGWNVGIMGRPLSTLDGWADQPDTNVTIVEEPDWHGLYAWEEHDEDSD